MKTIVYAAAAVAMLCSCKGQTDDLLEWRAIVKVSDEAGQPVSYANVTIGYYVAPPPNASTTIATDAKRGITNTNGIFTASGKTGSTDLFFGASKRGYYHSHLAHPFDKFQKNDPEKWNPTVNLLLKSVKNPIAMYARRVESGPPVYNKPVGYDLEMGDWVAPDGKGKTADIVFTGNLQQKVKNDFDYQLTIGFPQHGDGIQEFNLSTNEVASDLRSPHEAPEDGYQSEVVKNMSRHPGQGTQTDMNAKDKNYFFRVRTVLDENGNIKSALYGKIYGDFMQFRYYLNPSSNDRNIEFDPKENLLHGLKPSEQVSEP